MLAVGLVTPKSCTCVYFGHGAYGGEAWGEWGIGRAEERKKGRKSYFMFYVKAYKHA